MGLLVAGGAACGVYPRRPVAAPPGGTTATLSTTGSRQEGKEPSVVGLLGDGEGSQGGV